MFLSRERRRGFPSHKSFIGVIKGKACTARPSELSLPALLYPLEMRGGHSSQDLLWKSFKAKDGPFCYSFSWCFHRETPLTHSARARSSALNSDSIRWWRIQFEDNMGSSSYSQGRSDTWNNSSLHILPDAVRVFLSPLRPQVYIYRSRNGAHVLRFLYIIRKWGLFGWTGLNNKGKKWLSGQRQQAKQKALLLRLRGGRWRWEDGGGEGGGREGRHHLLQCSISFAWFMLSQAPTMQMTHKVEIERLWSRCQEWIYMWLPGGLGVLNHFQLDDTFNIEPLI